MPARTTRRAILAGAAAVPALSLPALAVGEPDPIFAAIERHRQVLALIALARRRITVIL